VSGKNHVRSISSHSHSKTLFNPRLIQIHSFINWRKYSHKVHVIFVQFWPKLKLSLKFKVLCPEKVEIFHADRLVDVCTWTRVRKDRRDLAVGRL
jgi:hypothetical protein